MDPIPTSILISTHPIHALRLSKTADSTKRSNDYHNTTLYCKPIPPSKRPKRNHQNNKTKQDSSPLPSTHSTTTNSSLRETTLSNKKPNNTTSSDPLSPALPHLPPTPLTPHEILQSTTLSRLFKKSNTVFSQIADSATGLIQNDLAIGNKLTQLTELLRGDLNSRSSIQLIQQQLEQQPNSNNDDVTTKYTTSPSSATQYQILTQTLNVIQSLFITPTPVSMPINSTSTEPPSNLIKGGPPASNPNPNHSDGGTRVVDVDEQNEIYQTSLIQINKFLGDLKDYRDRLMELRNGCLGIEKRRKAIWYLIKISCAGFDEILASSNNNNNNNNSSNLNSSSKVHVDLMKNSSHLVKKKNIDDSRFESDHSTRSHHNHQLDQQQQRKKHHQSEDESGIEFIQAASTEVGVHRPNQKPNLKSTTTTTTTSNNTNQQQKVKKNIKKSKINSNNNKQQEDKTKQENNPQTSIIPKNPPTSSSSSSSSPSIASSDHQQHANHSNNMTNVFNVTNKKTKKMSLDPLLHAPPPPPLHINNSNNNPLVGVVAPTSHRHVHDNSSSTLDLSFPSNSNLSPPVGVGGFNNPSSSNNNKN